MPHSGTSNSLRRTLVSKSWRNTLTVLLPQVSNLVALLTFRGLYGPVTSVVIGLVSTIFGAVSVLAMGCSVVALRAASIQRRRDPDDASGWAAVLRREFSAAWLVGLVTVVVTVLVLIPTAQITHVDSGLLFAYRMGNILWFLVMPATLTANGILQALDQDNRNLQAAVTVLGAQLLALAAILCWRPGVVTALLLTGIANGIISFASLAVRLQGVARLTGQDSIRFILPGAVRGPLKLLSDRLHAGADGLIYMTTFFVASAVAAAHSPLAGATIATAVAIMRMVIIPLKQMGLVGGRMSLQASPGTLPVLRVAAASIWPCSLAAVGLFLWGLTPWSHLPLPLVSLMALQLLLEPLAGVLFAALKVTHGASRGTALLTCTYWLGAVPAMAMVGWLGIAEPAALWTILLLARAVFALGSWRLANATTPALQSTT